MQAGVAGSGVAATFRPAFFPHYFAFTMMGMLAAFGLVWLHEWPDVNWVAAAVMAAAVAVLSFSGSRTLLNSLKVQVGPLGIRCPDTWGRHDDVLWPEIRRVSVLNLLLLRYFRIGRASGGSSLWLPVAIDKPEEFRDLVTKYAGRGHPLADALWQHMR